MRTDLHRSPRPGDKGLNLLPRKGDHALTSCLPQYTEDSCRRNSKWARVSRIFNARQITSAELQLLHALEWDLSITLQDVM